MRILKTTAQSVDSLSWASEPSCMPAQGVGFTRMVFLVIFIVKSAHQNDSEHFSITQLKFRVQQLTLSFFEHFFLKSHLSLQTFKLVGLLLFRIRAHEHLSVDRNQYLGLWKLQVGWWLCDQRWENSLILHPCHRQIPHWQPQGCGLCQGSQIRH